MHEKDGSRGGRSIGLEVGRRREDKEGRRKGEYTRSRGIERRERIGEKRYTTKGRSGVALGGGGGG
jgi:hypothetical protein